MLVSPASCAELRLHAGQSREAYARDGFLVRRGFLDEGQLEQLGGPVFRAYRGPQLPRDRGLPPARGGAEPAKVLNVTVTAVTE